MFIDHIATSTLVLEGGGRIGEYVGGYDDWLRQRPATDAPREKKTNVEKPAKIRGGAKLSYKNQRELDELPQRIEFLESEKAGLEENMSEADFYQRDSAAISSAQSRYKAVEHELELMYARWEALEVR